MLKFSTWATFSNLRMQCQCVFGASGLEVDAGGLALQMRMYLFSRNVLQHCSAVVIGRRPTPTIQSPDRLGPSPTFSDSLNN